MTTRIPALLALLAAAACAEAPEGTPPAVESEPAAAPTPALTAGAAANQAGEPAASDTTHTPPPGSAERRAILDAQRAEMQRFDPRPLRFEVPYLRVRGEWAWLEVEPRSPDGAEQYEPESALLRRSDRGWQVVERMPAWGEREGTALEDDCAYFAALRARFPALPPEVLPPAGRQPCPAGPAG